MRRKVNATKQKHGPKQQIRGDGQNAKRQIDQGDCGDCALHQRNHRCEGERGRADHGHYAGKYFTDQSVTPVSFISRITSCETRDRGSVQPNSLAGKRKPPPLTKRATTTSDRGSAIAAAFRPRDSSMCLETPARAMGYED